MTEEEFRAHLVDQTLAGHQVRRPFVEENELPKLLSWHEDDHLAVPFHAHPGGLPEA